MSVLLSRFCMSLCASARSSSFECSSALMVCSSSFMDCDSSLEVVSSSLADCNSSLVDCNSSLALSVPPGRRASPGATREFPRGRVPARVDYRSDGTGRPPSPRLGGRGAGDVAKDDHDGALERPWLWRARTVTSTVRGRIVFEPESAQFDRFFSCSASRRAAAKLRADRPDAP